MHPAIPEMSATIASATASATVPPTASAASSATLPLIEPPSIITDSKRGIQYSLGAKIGEGGFAKCYKVIELRSGGAFAAKVVRKSDLHKVKTKNKLLTEIKIHQSMKHQHIVAFKSVFEDPHFVYLILELCENKTMADLLKAKKRLPYEQVRVFLLQILEAIEYMQSRNVIHRDLKLGNLFLDSKHAIKIGDFGLATVVHHEGDRKRTICGTPNYIAPEVLFGQTSGHSFEVDIWSFGVIMYTLLFGRPPFQTSDVKAIYRNIKENKYTFPEDSDVPGSAKELVSALLNTNPEQRPKIAQIYASPFFSAELTPASADIKIGLQQNAALADKENMNVYSNRSSLAVASSIKVKQLNSNHPKISSQHENTETATTPKTKICGSGMIDSMFTILTNFLQERHIERPLGISVKPQAPDCYLMEWVDYSGKYGIGYKLSNGSIGVYFNDSTSVLNPHASEQLEYLEQEMKGNRKMIVHETHSMANIPDRLIKKVTLLKHFRNYLKPNDPPMNSAKSTGSLCFVVKCMKTKRAAIFRLSNRVVQFDFTDGVKMLLSMDGRVVTMIATNSAGVIKSECWYLWEMGSQHGAAVERLSYLHQTLESLLNKRTTQMQ